MPTSDPPSLRRRDLLRGAVAIATPVCCLTPIVPEHAIGYSGDNLSLNLGVVPELQKPGTARAVVDVPRNVNIIVVHVREQTFVALDRSCTHGGAQCTYNALRQSLRCTSLNHAEYDLEGNLLHGRTHGNLRTYPVRRNGDVLEIALAVKS